jgi:hypothetical protein
MYNAEIIYRSDVVTTYKAAPRVYYWLPPVRAHHISCSHENVTRSHRIVTPADFTFHSAYYYEEQDSQALVL